jgi:hypothetical protein
MDNKDEKRWWTGQNRLVFKLGGRAYIVGGNTSPQYL